MTRWLKIFLSVIAGALLLLLLAGVGIGLYVRANKEKLLKEITGQLNEYMQGTISIGKMDTELMRGFPDISVSLTNVTVRDSLWELHHHDLLHVENVYLYVNVFSLLKNKATIDKVSIRNGQIYAYTDTSGYANTAVFRDKGKSGKEPLHIEKIELEQVKVIFEHKAKFKLFNLNIASCKAKIDYQPGGPEIKIKTDIQVNDFTFNTEKGSFLKNKRLRGNLVVNYEERTKTLHVPQQHISIDKDEIGIKGAFVFAEKPASFTLNITSKGILYKNAAALVSPNISGKLGLVNLAKPVALDADIKGLMKFRDTPLVNVHWIVKNDVLTTPAGDIKKCSFEGDFNNEYIASNGHNDANSSISLKYLNGTWQDIAFKIKGMQAVNLLYPYLSATVTSSFELQKLNAIMGVHSLDFTKGTADINVFYKGYISEKSTKAPYVKGEVRISNADIAHVTRNLSFTNSNAVLAFTGSDLQLKKAELHAGNSSLSITGQLKNFFTLYNSNPENLSLDLAITSTNIDLDQLLVLSQKRKAIKQSRSPYQLVESTSEKMDHALGQGRVHVSLNVNRLVYKKFTATDVRAKVTLTQKEILLRDVQLNNAGGKLTLNADIDRPGNTNPFKLNASAQNINVQEFFTSFDNFGQDAITNKNIRGILNTQVAVTGKFYEGWKVEPRTLKGRVDAKLMNGELLDFEPFEKMGKIIFRRRDMSHVSFGKLETRLDIDGNLITIAPTHIESSVITANIEGVYSLTTGTDMDIVVSLRNPKKDELVVDDELRAEKSMKGINVRLKAVDGDDGNVKIKLDKVKM